MMKLALRGTLLVLLTSGGMQAHAAQTEPECGNVTNNPELAIQVCTRLIEFAGLDRPNLAKAYYARGSEYATQGKHDRAVVDLSMAIELDQKLPGVYFNRALSYSEVGEHDRAIADYDAALQLSPRDARAHVGRAVEWTIKGDFKRAIEDYEQVMGIDAQSMAAWFGRGRARFYAGDFLSAASDFLRAHQLDASLYTALWIYLARKRADIPGEKTLAQEAGTSGEGDWPAPLVALYLGRSTPEAVQKAAAHADTTRHRDQRCEASFYIGQWHLLRGAREPAAQLLRDARTLCPTAFIEHEGATAELHRLHQ